MADWRAWPHRRLNPLTGEWVLVSPHRMDRPWLGEQSAEPCGQIPQHDPNCYLCPGNERAGGVRNPLYNSVFVFDNDYAALLPPLATDEAAEASDGGSLLQARPEAGRCRVLCFSPRHDLHLGAMGTDAIGRVVDACAREYRELASLPFVNAVTIFENRGAMMGASNPHPHGQIWANASVPNELRKETTTQQAYEREHGGCLLCAYAEYELEKAERVVYASEEVIVIVPFWAAWPFETLVIGRRHRQSLDQLDPDERAGLAQAIGDLCARYDRLFGVPFPYSMGFHQQPCDGERYDAWHLHAHYYPPLLRSATVRKYLVGYEMLAQPQRDLLAEEAAQRLRDI